MTREEYVSYIKRTLGAPIVDVETEPLLGDIVDDAFRDVRQYITDTRFMTVNYSSKGIDLKDRKVNTVVQIFRTKNPSRITGFEDIYALNTMTSANTSQSNVLMSDYLYRTQLNQLKSTMSTDLDFTYDKETRMLYINTFFPKPTKLTIAYIPEFESVEEVTEDYWVNYIRRLALALAKESLGRVRGKYELSSSLYKLDGSSLVAEGISERDAIRAELKENSDIALPID